jgi:hypothetical protein
VGARHERCYCGGNRKIEWGAAGAVRGLGGRKGPRRSSATGSDPAVWRFPPGGTALHPAHWHWMPCGNAFTSSGAGSGAVEVDLAMPPASSRAAGTPGYTSNNLSVA